MVPQFSSLDGMLTIVVLHANSVKMETSYILNNGDLDITWSRKSAIRSCSEGANMLLSYFIFNFLPNIEETSDGTKKVPGLSHNVSTYHPRYDDSVKYTFINTPRLSS